MSEYDLDHIGRVAVGTAGERVPVSSILGMLSMSNNNTP